MANLIQSIKFPAQAPPVMDDDPKEKPRDMAAAAAQAAADACQESRDHYLATIYHMVYQYELEKENMADEVCSSAARCHNRRPPAIFCDTRPSYRVIPQGGSCSVFHSPKSPPCP